MDKKPEVKLKITEYWWAWVLLAVGVYGVSKYIDSEDRRISRDRRNLNE